MSDRALPPELAEQLARSRRGLLLTLRRDGSPTAHPMTALEVDGRLAYNTYRKSAKARNIARDPRTCSLVLSGWEGDALEALVYKGPAREIEAAAAAPAEAARAELPVENSVAKRAQERLASGKRVMLAVDPEEVGRLERLRGS